MAPQDDGLSLRFDLGRHSPFFFKCQRCSVCCSNKDIKVGPHEILRLSRNLSLTSREFLVAYIEEQNVSLRRKPNGECVFLTSQGCSVHQDRPLVCRLYPLGLLWDAEEKERFSNMPPHPDCLGYWSEEGTVEEYLQSQDVGFFLVHEQKYSRIFDQIAAKYPDRNALKDPLSPLFDIDSAVADSCDRPGVRPPIDGDEIIKVHLLFLSRFVRGEPAVKSGEDEER